ncbi:MAG: membrane protein insertase YidC, partial [Candidatus Methylomirabilales bacterium]
MEKRVILFLLLSLAILLGYDYLLREMGITPPPAQPDQSRPGTGSGGEGAAPAAAPAAGAGSPAARSGDPSPSSLSSSPSGRPDVAGARPSSEEGTEEVVTDLFRAVFTNRGAAITSWQLTRYTNGGPDGPQPIQLIHTEGKFLKPLSIQSTDAALNHQLAEGLYQVERDFMTLDASHPVGHLTFAYRAPGTGITVEKRLTFRHHSYVVDVS